MLRDIFGNPVPVGKTTRILEETFLATSTLPTWMNVSGIGNPSYSIVGPDADYGYLQVNTSGNAGDTGRLMVIPNGIDLSKVKEVAFTLESLVFSSADIEVYFEITDLNASLGCSVVQQTTTVQFRPRPSNINIGLTYEMIRYGEYKRRRNLTLAIRSDRTVIFLEGDNVIAEKQFAPNEMALGVAIPRLTIKTLVNSPQWFRVSKVRLAVTHN